MSEQKSNFVRTTKGRVVVGIGVVIAGVLAVLMGIKFQEGGTDTLGSIVPAQQFPGQEVLRTVTGKKIADLSKTFGPIAQQRLTAWRALMLSPENIGLPERKRLELVNDFINQTPFVSDLEQWGREIYWALPVEFLSTNGGDGEDFAMAKYFTLRALGVPDAKLKITTVKGTEVRIKAHMVLAYFETPESEPIILDNFDKTLQPLSARKDLALVYSFNETGLQGSVQRGSAQSDGSSDHIISRWNDIKRRMNAAI